MTEEELQARKGFANETGTGCFLCKKDEDGTIEKYELFPGIVLYIMDIFNDALKAEDIPENMPNDVITINHCAEGRFEGETKDSEFVYLGEGDVGIADKVGSLLKRKFPLSRYRGSLLVIEEEKAANFFLRLSECFGIVPVDFDRVKKNIPDDEKLIILRKSPLAALFDVFYKESTREKPFYLRIRVLEILSRLSEENDFSSACRFFERRRVEAVKQMRNFLVDHIEEKYTQEDLSKLYNIPLTSLKECFKAVFGMPVNTYMREYRIKVASGLLRETTLSVAEVSEKVGYANQSKFAEVFKERTSMSPMEYRNKSYR